MTSYTRFAAMVLLLAPCSVCAFTPAGYWLMDDKETVIEFKPCGEKLCGYLIFIGENSNVKDEKNPVLEKRTRPLCNLEFIVGLKLDGERYSDGRWAGEHPCRRPSRWSSGRHDTEPNGNAIPEPAETEGTDSRSSPAPARWNPGGGGPAAG